MREVELWEAVALSLNLGPDELPVYLGAYERLGDNPFRNCPSDFLERLQIANSHGGTTLPLKPVHSLKARCIVDLPTFGAWAASIWTDLPHELPKAASAVAPEPQAAPVKAGNVAAPETTGQRCARVLLWFEEEKKKGERGAQARVVKRDGRARPTVVADIKRAQKQKEESSNPMAMMGRKIHF